MNPSDPRSVTGEKLVLPGPPPNGFDPAVTVTFEGAPPIQAEVARTSSQRRRGLMQRTELPEGTGMVFLFSRPVSDGFYMLGTLIPLSIAYVNGDTVVSVQEMEPCPTQRCPTYDPEAQYTFAVEARKGFFAEHGVAVGTKVTITGATQKPSL